MMNLYELELQMQTASKEMEQKVSAARYVQVPLIDWMLVAAALSCLFL